MAAKAVIFLCLVVITFISLWFLKPRFDNDIQLKCFRSWIKAKIGKDVVLASCRANGSVKKGATSLLDVDYVREIDLNQARRYVSLANGSLQIKNIVRADFGLYICDDDDESGERVRTQLTPMIDELASIYVFIYTVVALVLIPSLIYLLYIIIKVWLTKKKFKEPFTFKSNEESWFLNLWNAIKSFGKACKHSLSVVWKYIKNCGKKGSGSESRHDDDKCCVSRICNLIASNKYVAIGFKAVKTSFFKIAICAFDVATDIIQATIHYKNEDYVWGSFTTFFVIFPFILSIFFNFRHVSKKLQSKSSQSFKEIRHLIGQAFRDCLLHLPIIQLCKHFQVTYEVLGLEWELLKEAEKIKKPRESTQEADGNEQEKRPSMAVHTIARQGERENGDAVEMQVMLPSNPGTSNEGQVVANTQERRPSNNTDKPSCCFSCCKIPKSSPYSVPEDVYKNYLNLKKHTKRKIAAFESEFQKFTVLECMGESVPQSILQMGIILRATPNTLGSGINILTNVTILTSILKMVQTFTNMFLKMPYGEPEAKDEPSDQRTAEEGQMQQSNMTKNDNHDTSKSQQSDETGKTSCWPTFLCGTKSEKKHHPNLKFPYKTLKSSILIGPVMLATILPRVCNLALIFTLEKVWMWIAFSIFGILFAIYWKLYHFIFKVRQEKWLKSDMFIYSLILSIIAPCVRLYPATKSSIWASALLSVGFHYILLIIIWPLTYTTPMIFTQCGHVEFYQELCIISCVMLAISVAFSYILYLFSDGEFRQLMGLVGWPFDSPLSCPKMDVYKMAVEKEWMNVLKHLIQADIESIRGIEDPKQIEANLKKKGRINWPFKKDQTVVHEACSDLRNTELVELFLKAPPELGHFQAKDKNSMTPLHEACSMGLKDIVELILKDGRHLANINAKDKLMKRTPFMIACTNGYLDVVKVFLNNLNENIQLKDFNLANKDGLTPFMYACATSNLKLVALFLECNQADQINFGAKENRQQQNVWHILAKGNEEKLKIMRRFVQNGRSEHINEKDKKGRTPYLVSCTAGNDLAFKWFLRHSEEFKIELDAVDQIGMNARQLACKSKATEIIKEFVQKGYYDNGEPRNGRKVFTEHFQSETESETWTIDVTFDAFGYPTEVDVERMVNDEFDLDNFFG